MVKKGIHPEIHEVNVVFTNGQKAKMRSSWGKPGDTMKLDVDPFNHPAWRKEGSGQVILQDDQVTKFYAKFGKMDFGKKKEGETSENK